MLRCESFSKYQDTVDLLTSDILQKITFSGYMVGQKNFSN
jgi:hypothetical protein